LAKVIGRLAAGERELTTLPDNYALAVESKQFPADHDEDEPQRPFLPSDLFDPDGPWVRFHEMTAGVKPMARRHFEAAGGRAVHFVFLRLPAGRQATEKYLSALQPLGDSLRDGQADIEQFPAGTMVAMVRRALTVDASAKIRLTPLTELVQIRVYRQIPGDVNARRGVDPSEQDVYEFVLDRQRLSQREHALRAVGPDDPSEPFERDGHDPQPNAGRQVDNSAQQLSTCIHCHQQPGIHSLLSIQRGLAADPRRGREIFRTYDWDVEVSYTITSKTAQFNWGLLQGMLEARRVDAGRN
jgi:hypothetical protein